MDFKRNIVENTNDSAVVSKYSMSRKGYASDPFLEYFVTGKDRQRNRSPLINRFYYLRFKAIEYAFNRFSHLNQIISIGCGFDTSCLRHSNINFIEIDFPIVAINKANILIDNQLIGTDRTCFSSNNDNYLNYNQPFVVLRTDKFCLIGADLRKYNQLKQLFIEENLLKDINKETKIGLFNECSLCYLKQEISDSVINVFSDLYRDKCHSITYLGFEQLKPNQLNDGFSRVMLKHFQTIGSPLKTFLSEQQMIDRFKVGLNFNSIEILSMKTFYDNYIDLNEKQRINSLEMFDEWEEFESVSNCYVLTIAQTIHTPKNYLMTELSIEDKLQIKAISKQINKTYDLLRFGHSSCLTKDNKIIVFGGFGCDSDNTEQNSLKSSHKRLTNLIKFNTKSDETINFKPIDKSNEIKGIHSQIVEINDNLLLKIGGRLSPSSVLDNKVIKLFDESQTYETQSLDKLNVFVPKVFRHLILNQLNFNQIIQFGGKTVDNKTNSEDNCYYVLDTNLMNWRKQTKRNIFCGIHSHSGISLNPNVFLINGGLNCQTNDFTTNHLYLIDERVCHSIEVDVKSLNHLYSHSVKLLNENQLLIIGGMAKTGPNNRIDLLDLRSNQLIRTYDIISESTLLLTNFTSELVKIDECPELWLIGGGGNCFSFGTHFNKLSSIDVKVL